MRKSLPEHIPVLDGLRGLAILSVILVHSLQTTTGLVDAPPFRWNYVFRQFAGIGWAGVDLFFVLSGFLITGILYDMKSGPRYFRNFYMRRTVRIFPLYYTFLFLRILPWPGLRSLGDWELTASLLYGVNIWQVAQTDLAVRYDQILAVTWSLAVEEQFYLFWPLIVWLVPRRLLAGACLVCVPVAVASRWACLNLGTVPDWWALYTLTPCRLDSFALGGLTAVLLRQWGLRSLVYSAWAVMVCSFLGVSLIVLSKGSHFASKPMALYGFSLLGFFFSSMIVLSLSNQYISAIFTWSLLRQIGKYSYAMYLFHFPLLTTILPNFLPEGVRYTSLELTTLTIFAGTTAASFCLALLSWHLLEKRFLALKRYFPRTQPTPEVVLEGRG